MIRLARWRGLRRKPAASSVSDDVFAGSRPAAEHDALDPLLDEIETVALSVYEAHGLPTDRGHYARSPRTKIWKFIAEDLTPEERFALVQANPPERGWRFGQLGDLGRLSQNPDLKAAAELLDGAARLRVLRRRPVTPDDLAEVVRLGAAWSAVREVQVIRASPLSLTAPERRKPDRRRKKD
jgi:hypothetical protein